MDTLDPVIAAGVPVVVAAGVPMVVALTQALKPWLAAKDYPLVALLLGVLWAAAYQVPTTVSAAAASILTGVTVGLVACGLYGAGKHIVTTPNPKAKPKEASPAKGAM